MKDKLKKHFLEEFGAGCKFEDTRHYSYDRVLGRILHRIQLPIFNFNKDEKDKRRKTIRRQLEKVLAYEDLKFVKDDRCYMYFSKDSEEVPSTIVLCSPIHHFANTNITIYDQSVLNKPKRISY